MKCLLVVFLMALAIFSCKTPPAKSPYKTQFPSFDPDYPPPAGAKNLFELSQDYPDTFKVDEVYPWTAIDFKKDYKAYMQAVLHYCLEGNLDVDFKVQDNKVRKWYHAPWLHVTLNGREYHHGLTRERPVPPFELNKKQNVGLENWAVGFYNPPGGYTIGKVWESDSIPALQLADFPEGTVSFKLLFTTGTPDKIPFLKGSKEWTANIYPCNPQSGTPAQQAACKAKRIDSTVRLLQIDIAVKDKRAGEAGWAFGTFIYDAGKGGTTVWDKIVPVGLMWGDDSNVDTLINKEGAFINPKLQETVLNADLIEITAATNNLKAYLSHHGLGGRLNGPVDNPISSCISCHSKAAVTDFGSPAPLANFKLTRKTFTVAAFQEYFSPIKGGTGPLTFEGQTYNKLDYSLQLAAGIRNFYQSLIDKSKINNPNFSKSSAIQDLPEVTRDGLIEHK
ncbi:hypothetical protein [Chitinophaga nivalis]|uniref:Cytochrome c domain-containing protein n=1 Tax=Chitinophaga nivalis TaxID=2991709 RepID=A0ABT3IU73_9BACT|nr:hypothetical protein [Chitinophaga nivalis]MCW3463040.1 hypothetical protein [Chitinophaga nivalis]MCW3487270.1 hypothetical protein [Chitinophaga nivalis]